MEQLSGQDAMFVHSELDGLPQHIGGVSIYNQDTAAGGKVRFKQILEFLESRIHLSPIFTRKLVTVPWNLDQPYWIEDPDFNIEYHVRASSPGARTASAAIRTTCVASAPSAGRGASASTSTAR